MRRFSLLPLACYGVLIAYACYAWFQIGHWPYYAHPDPKELPHRVLLNIATFAFLVGICSVIIVPVGYLIWRMVMAWRKKPAPPHRRPVLWYLAGVALWVLDSVAEPAAMPWTSNISWLLD
jgi:hypothetical protein